MSSHPEEPQFVTDAAGQKVAVILSLQKYEDLMEDLADLAVLAERRDEETVSHEDVLKDLRQRGAI